MLLQPHQATLSNTYSGFLYTLGRLFINASETIEQELTRRPDVMCCVLSPEGPLNLNGSELPTITRFPESVKDVIR